MKPGATALLDVGMPPDGGRGLLIAPTPQSSVSVHVVGAPPSVALTATIHAQGLDHQGAVWRQLTEHDMGRSRRFSHELPVGKYAVAVKTGQLRGFEEFSVMGADTEVTVTVVLESERSYSILVTSRAGQPCIGVNVAADLFSRNGEVDRIEGRTGEDGAYVLASPELQTLVVRAWTHDLAGYSNVWFEKRTDGVVHCVLEAGGVIRGSVSGLASGPASGPAAPVVVQATRTGQPVEYRSTWMVHRCEVGADGRFEIGPVCPGHYIITCHMPPGTRYVQWLRRQRVTQLPPIADPDKAPFEPLTVRVTPGDSAFVEIACVPGRFVRGVVRNLAGESTEAVVFARSSLGLGSAAPEDLVCVERKQQFGFWHPAVQGDSVKTDGDGRFRFAYPTDRNGLLFAIAREGLAVLPVRAGSQDIDADPILCEGLEIETGVPGEFVLSRSRDGRKQILTAGDRGLIRLDWIGRERYELRRPGSDACAVLDRREAGAANRLDLTDVFLARSRWRVMWGRSPASGAVLRQHGSEAIADAEGRAELPAAAGYVTVVWSHTIHAVPVLPVLPVLEEPGEQLVELPTGGLELGLEAWAGAKEVDVLLRGPTECVWLQIRPGTGGARVRGLVHGDYELICKGLGFSERRHASVWGPVTVIALEPPETMELNIRVVGGSDPPLDGLRYRVIDESGALLSSRRGLSWGRQTIVVKKAERFVVGVDDYLDIDGERWAIRGRAEGRRGQEEIELGLKVRRSEGPK